MFEIVKYWNSLGSIKILLLPPRGQTDKDPDTGEPTGLLFERAVEAVEELIPPYTVEQNKEGLLGFYNNSLNGV